MAEEMAIIIDRVAVSHGAMSVQNAQIFCILLHVNKASPFLEHALENIHLAILNRSFDWLARLIK